MAADKKKSISRDSKKKTLAAGAQAPQLENRKRGPRLPNAIKRDVDSLNPEPSLSDADEDAAFAAADIYAYEEEDPEEESRKNKRYDPVENLEFELPSDFEDEDILSDEDVDGDDEDVDVIQRRHSNLLQQVTGMPALVFEGKRKKDFVVSEAYPESEFNPTSDVLAGNANLSIQDLLAPLHDVPGYQKLKKKMKKGEKEMPMQTPLPKPEQDRIQRAVVYNHSKKELTKWEPLVKRNREAPTIYFDDNVDIGFATVGAIASEFKPRTDFEKQMASLVRSDEVLDARRKDGARLLELNKIDAEEVKDRQNRLAKMRSLLFRHEMKSKHVKKIKSKTYHRLMKKDKLKAAAIDLLMDPEEAKELERKQEFERAEERLTLKHKNKSKWAKRILERGLDIQGDGTRAAFQEQLREHERLKRKMNSMRESSSSDDDDSEDDSDVSDTEDALKLLDKASEKTKTLMDEDDELPKSSVLSLPFMERAMKKKKEASNEEARLALQEYEALKHKVDNKSEVNASKGSVASGRRVYGATRKQGKESKADKKREIDNAGSDSEDDFEADEQLQTGHTGMKDMQTDVDVDVDLDVLREDSETANDSLFKPVDDISKQPGAKAAYDVAVFASGSWKKMKYGDKKKAKTDSKRNDEDVGEPVLDAEQGEELDEHSDPENEDQMIDGILSAETKEPYKLPSQEELIRRAFAGDDVEEEFVQAKEDILDEENPKPEEPSLMPGWGQWASTKKKRIPGWMREEHEKAKKLRDEALKKRKDAQLKHVIISEKVDKKAEKLHTKTLPYPFTSQEVFEQSIRMPIGPDFNPATTFRAINRPEVVKRSGLIIKPISYEEVNPHEKGGDEQKQASGRKRKANAKVAAQKKKSK